MGYRQVFIKRCNKLNFKDNQLIITKDDLETKIPLEDINYILLEDTSTIITSRLLAELGKYAIAMILCDEKHLPSSILFPYNHHYKQLEILELQLSMTKNYKNELWNLIVKSKINNQKHLLEVKTDDFETIQKLDNFSLEVVNGDLGNREGLAAKMYFRSLFGSDFIRHYDDSINNALNYGYTIIASCVIRNLSIYGLLTYYGINHKSKTNNFNLAYDFVEPFRPIVDEYVFNNIEKLSDSLSFEVKKELINIINKQVIVDNRKCSIEYAIDLLVKSYIKSLNTGFVELSLPVLVYD